MVNPGLADPGLADPDDSLHGQTVLFIDRVHMRERALVLELPLVAAR